jgi:hypothetical protein
MAQNRVDWSDHRISPALYEDMVSVLISRLYANTQRIDGTGGDGGRDVQINLPSGLEIFELKSFIGRMNYARRRQVAKSLVNAAKHSPSAWHLVVPINPNPTELKWFNTLIEKYSFSCDWRGMDWLDGHMADHPSLLRYYIEGSSEEIVSVLRELSKEQAYLAGGVPDAFERIRVLTNRLNELDPHYAFAFFSSPMDGIKVAIVPRYPGAERDRPISVSASFHFPDTESGKAQATALDEAISYGTPATVSGEFISDLSFRGIAGLDGFTAGQLAFGAAIPTTARDMIPEIALRLLDKFGIVRMQLPLRALSRNIGTAGGDVVLTDHSGAIRVKTRLNTTTHQFNLNYHFSTPEKILPAAILPPLRFLLGLSSGLQLVILMSGEPVGPPVSEDKTPSDELLRYERVATELDEIQRKSGIYFPMPASLSIDEFEDIMQARRLLDGETIHTEWESSQMTMPASALDDLHQLFNGETRMLWGRVPYTLTIEGQSYLLGYMLRTQTSARVAETPELSPDTSPNTQISVTFIPGEDATVTMRLLTKEELEAAALEENEPSERNN